MGRYAWSQVASRIIPGTGSLLGVYQGLVGTSQGGCIRGLDILGGRLLGARFTWGKG